MAPVGGPSGRHLPGVARRHLGHPGRGARASPIRASSKRWTGGTAGGSSGPPPTVGRGTSPTTTVTSPAAPSPSSPSSPQHPVALGPDRPVPVGRGHHHHHGDRPHRHGRRVGTGPALRRPVVGRPRHPAGGRLPRILRPVHGVLGGMGAHLPGLRAPGPPAEAVAPGRPARTAGQLHHAGGPGLRGELSVVRLPRAVRRPEELAGPRRAHTRPLRLPLLPDVDLAAHRQPQRAGG